MYIYLSAKKLDITTNDILVAMMNEFDAKEYGLTAGNSVHIKWKENKEGISMVVDTTQTIVKKGNIAFFSDFYEKYEMKDGETMQIEIVSVQESMSAIQNKLLGKKIGFEEMNNIVKDIQLNKLSPVQIAYFVGAGFSPGMDEEEITYLTRAMADNGEKFKFEGIVVDKHSIGGVAGKEITPLVIPMLACFDNFIVPNTSSRAVTSASATTDMLEVLMRMDFKKEDLVEMINKDRCFMVWGGGLDLAPADDHIIRVHKQLGIESIDKFVASIMAKKIAQGVNHVIFDVPSGPGAKINSEKEFQEVKENFEKLGEKFGIKVALFKRNVNSIDGHSVGPSLECVELLQIYEKNPKASSKLLEDAVGMTATLVEKTGMMTRAQAEAKAREYFDSGKSEEKFRQIIANQQGNREIKSNMIEIGAVRKDYIAHKSGVIKSINNKKVFELCKALGNPTIKEAGVYFHKLPPSEVDVGDALFTMYATNENRIALGLKMLEDVDLYEWED